MNTNRKPSVIHGIPLKRKPSRHKLMGRQYLPSLKIMLGPSHDIADQTGFISTSSPRIAYVAYFDERGWRVDTVEWLGSDKFSWRSFIDDQDEELSVSDFIKQLQSQYN